MDKKKLYFTCALSGLPWEHREEMIALRDSLADEFEILEFCDPREMTPQEIFEFDIDHCVANADIILAICDKPSLGAGYEIGTMAEKWGKPVFAVAHRDNTTLSSLITGNTRPNFEFARYDDVSEIKGMLVEFSKREFVRPKKYTYLVLTHSTPFDVIQKPTLPRLVTSDPKTALDCARSICKGSSLNPPSVIICRMEGDYYWDYDYLDQSAKSPVVYKGGPGPDFDIFFESFGPGFRKECGEE
jgi:hypothetical protein